MNGGFSFCGTDIDTLGIRYAPDLPSTYVYNQAYSNHAEAFEAHHGGYHYGDTVKPKEFRLRCYFEDANINHGTIDRVLSFFRRGRCGRLVFRQREWLWYNATVISVDTSQLRNYLNGVITVTMSAFFPFGRCDFLSIDEGMSDASLLENSGFIKSSLMPPTQFSNIGANKQFLLYNPGNEEAPVAIEIAGDAGDDGIVITNTSNGTHCNLVAFTKQSTTLAGKTIITDGLNGKTVLTDGQNASVFFMAHDHGFLSLNPSHPIRRDISISYRNNILTTESGFDAQDIGRHISINGTWYKITEVNATGEARIDDSQRPISNQGTCVTSAVRMNEIVVQLSPGAHIDTLRFLYKPTFR